jgi:hypothetical protein
MGPEDSKRRAGQRRRDENDQHDVLDVPELGVGVERPTLDPAEEERIQKIQDRAQGADVRAEEPADESRGHEQRETPDGPWNPRTPGHDRAEPEERVQAQVDVGRKPIGKPVIGQREQEREEGERESLDCDPHAAAFRMFSPSTSIFPRPRWLAASKCSTWRPLNC